MNKPSRKQDIDALIAQIKFQYNEIEGLYNASLREKQIKSDLKIKVKNLLENSRSILDYCAHDIAAVSGISSQKICFPIVARDNDQIGFEGAIGRNLPRLELANKKIFDYLESIQPYHAEYAWLADFATVTNDIKHSQLTPQTKNEVERVVSTHSGGGQVSWNPGAVKFGSGVWINGAPINPVTQMPSATPETTVTREIWVDFRFNDSISALPLMKKINEEVVVIIEAIYSLI